MYFVIISFILITVILAALISTGGHLISSKSKLLKLLGFGLLAFAVSMIFQSFLVSSYPDPSTSYVVEDKVIREYNPDESYTLCNIERWIKVEDLGWVYFKGIDADDNQLRLFYRRPGLIGNLIFDLEAKLNDDYGNEYEGDGGAIHGALIVSSGSLDFVADSDMIKKGKEFVIEIGGQSYRLY